jgi:RND superfamily putative drug exporter
MFRVLGNFVTRTWPILLAAWILLLLGVWLKAPPWHEVAKDLEFGFLPTTAPSRVGEEKFKQGFPQESLGSNIVLVIERGPDQTGPPEREKQFIEDVVEPGLRQIAKESGGLASEATKEGELTFGEPSKEPAETPATPIISRIETPNAPGSGALLISEDKKALLTVIDLTSEYHSKLNWPTIAKVEEFIQRLLDEKKLPEGDRIYLTGSAVVGRDHTLAEGRSAQATGVWTVILVIGMLVVIYRAPFLALIPLATVFVATELSLHLIALLGSWGWIEVFEGLEIFIVILTYGAGVDYYLLLSARCKEELDKGGTIREAVAHALEKTGAAITASAGTVMLGIGMMAFAEFGKFHQAGMAIPLALTVVLAATLTFSGPLLLLTGKWAFWPHKIRTRKPSDFEKTPYGSEGADSLLPEGLDRYWHRVADYLVRRPGTAWLAGVVVFLPFAVAAVLLSGHVSFNLVGELPPETPSVAGTHALETHFPPGAMGATVVLIVNPKVDFKSEAGRQAIVDLSDKLKDEKAKLGLKDIRSFAYPLGITEAAQNAFEDAKLARETIDQALREQSVEHYLTDFGERAKTGARLDLVFDQGPFEAASIDNLGKVQKALRENLPALLRDGTEVYYVGATASVQDLRAVTDRDRVQIQVTVLAVVFVILVILLRKVAVSAYLIASVLFSYYATLGVTYALFWALDPGHFPGLDWKVNIFLFTILIAVGEDYNIFLMTRIQEEQQRHGKLRGILVALVRTGSVISSAGIIMAGTFASLLAGSLPEMKQLGFALAFGVLLDTYLVRPVLVPAFLIMINREKPGKGRLFIRSADESAA